MLTRSKWTQLLSNLGSHTIIIAQIIVEATPNARNVLPQRRVVFKRTPSSVPQAYTVSAHLGENIWDSTGAGRRTDISMSKEYNWVDEALLTCNDVSLQVVRKCKSQSLAANWALSQWENETAMYGACIMTDIFGVSSWRNTFKDSVLLMNSGP
ncbi:uncharacterized protein LACBIDRAFT_335995 [Laccaria bicolor S238N-H82]|uniref:Predicted protein n=1 Tax=Laccaria bicolor (strain S238N-H82 / ATCC MYA-4686) TaxID=486041 RepID=B0E434_LACBS|nr:uncharacterized protein LACBIDRAFT_335995 [Laccaria bicolor S238N-H82]EDQ98394.1 predicted protein [Laccaria bicolor S238N-H82]|eukprot:XP_001890952.1 predicted protein [Laccaria bicolor S238N-H82]